MGQSQKVDGLTSRNATPTVQPTTVQILGALPKKRHTGWSAYCPLLRKFTHVTHWLVKQNLHSGLPLLQASPSWCSTIKNLQVLGGCSKSISAQKEQQWPATVRISITHTGDSLDATAGARAAPPSGTTLQGHPRPQKKLLRGQPPEGRRECRLDCGGLEKNYRVNAISTKVRKSTLSAKTSHLKSSLAMLLLP